MARGGLVDQSFMLFLVHVKLDKDSGNMTLWLPNLSVFFHKYDLVEVKLVLAAEGLCVCVYQVDM